MNCPNDNSELRMSERSGVEVDYCPQCRGVWLDRGELDKILDRSSEVEEEWRRPQDDRDRNSDRHDDRDRHDRDRHDKSRRSSKSKRKSFLNEFFEF
jgi:Zn-finger nucleic acid-binding protein